MKVSAVLNTYNASEHLDKVLRHLASFDEIVVCDMESTDDTVEIARRHGARVVTFPKGDINIVEPARNFAIQSASNEWVLVVDADEIIPDKLAAFIAEYVERPDAADGLYIPMLNMLVEGHASTNYPDYHCRLLRKSKCDWPPTIHSRPIIAGRTEYIPRRRKDLAMIHMPHPFSALFHKKLCVYTDNEVKRRGATAGRVTIAALIFKPWFRFFKSYILKGAIFKGRVGLIEARMEQMYKFITLTKLYEMQQSKK